MKLSSNCRRLRLPRILITVPCIALLFAATCLKAESRTQPKAQPAAAAPIFDATHLRETTELDAAPWRIHAGDDPPYARPDFDDSHWTPFDPHNSLKTFFPNNHPEIVWYSSLRPNLNQSK